MSLNSTDTFGLALTQITLENNLSHEEMALLNLKHVPVGIDSGLDPANTMAHQCPLPYAEEIQDKENLPSQNVMDLAISAKDWTFADSCYDFGNIATPLTGPNSSTVNTSILNPITGVTWDTEDQDLAENKQRSDLDEDVDESDMVDTMLSE